MDKMSTLQLNLRSDISQPMYTQIKECIKQQILDGEYVAHQKLPSENNMMKMFGVSRITVRQALKDLHNDGLVFSVQGKGTFVSKPSVVQNIQKLQGFAEAMAARGFEASTRVISICKIKPSIEIQEALDVESISEVTEIKRVRYLNREPISFDTSYFPDFIAKKLMDYDLTKDVFSIFENQLNLNLAYADMKIGAAICQSRECELLNLNPGSAVLEIRRLVRTMNGTPIDFERLVYRADSFQYELRVHKD